MKRFIILIALIFCSNFARAEGEFDYYDPARIISSTVSIRCVNAAGTGFEACGSNGINYIGDEITIHLGVAGPLTYKLLAIPSSVTLQGNSILLTDLAASTATLASELTAIATTYVNVTGDEMTGQLTIAGSSLTAEGRVSATQFDINGSTALWIYTGGSDESIYLGYYVTPNTNTGSGNTFMGRANGLYGTTGDYNSFYGANAGYYNTTGDYNTFLGAGAGASNYYGDNNVMVGQQAGAACSQYTSSNTLVGMKAGYGAADGGNTCIGYFAGYDLQIGTRNILIGYDSNPPSNTAYGWLDIGGLITGDMVRSSVTIVGDLYVNSYYGDGSTLSNVTAGSVTANHVYMNTLPGSTYNNMQDYIYSIPSAGRIDGGALISDNGDGTIKISSGTGLIKIIDVSTAPLYPFDWDETASFALDEGINYVYIKLVAGTPTISKTNDRHTINLNNEFTIGRVYKNGLAALHIVASGINISNLPRLGHERLVDLRMFERCCGGVISSTDTRSLRMTSGRFYLGENNIILAAQDTSPLGGDTFTGWMRDGSGGWISIPVLTQVDNVSWDDGSGSSATITVNKYGVRWGWIHYDGDIHILLGQGNYSLTEAQNASVPDSIPDSLNLFGLLATKIIVQRDAASFESIVSAYKQLFPISNPSNHNDLGGIDGSGTYHFTVGEHTELVEWASDIILLSADCNAETPNHAGQICTMDSATTPVWVSTDTNPGGFAAIQLQ